MADVLDAILACMEDIVQSRELQQPGSVSLMIWELDQVTELRRLLDEAGMKSI